MDIWERLQAGLPLTIRDRRRVGTALEVVCRYMRDDVIDADLLKKAMRDLDREAEEE